MVDIKLDVRKTTKETTALVGIIREEESNSHPKKSAVISEGNILILFIFNYIIILCVLLLWLVAARKCIAFTFFGKLEAVPVSAGVYLTAWTAY